MTSDQPVYHDERVRAAAEAYEELTRRAPRPWSRDAARCVIEASGYPAEVARLEREVTGLKMAIVAKGCSVREAQDAVARLRADLDRALDALANMVRWHQRQVRIGTDDFAADLADFVSELREAEDVLAAHDQEPGG